MDLSFASHKLEMFSANSGKVHFKVLIHLLIYIRDNKTLGLKYYADMNDEPLNDLLRQANIKTQNHLMDFSDSSWKDCTDTGISTGAYIIFYQGGLHMIIDLSIVYKSGLEFCITQVRKVFSKSW